MFTGIIESFGKVVALRPENDNLHITLECPFIDETRIDQSIAHNGVCLTITEISENKYTVTAIHETLQKTNLGLLKVGDLVNLERSMMMNGRIDGHIVQGHVDIVATCTSVEDQNGSWLFTFRYDAEKGNENVTVEKGSVCVNGVSLTVVNSKKDAFSVAIIPYTFEHTNFKSILEGTKVNIEFDIFGKYVARYLGLKK